MLGKQTAENKEHSQCVPGMTAAQDGLMIYVLRLCCKYEFEPNYFT